MMMKRSNLLIISFFCLAASLSSGVRAQSRGPNGADIYCYMRNGGISHEPSWQAAYESIKKDSQGIFKISPKKAASIIVEEVVQEPSKYNNCSNFLGELYGGDGITSFIDDNDQLKEEITTLEEEVNPKAINSKPSKGSYIDRYSY